MAGDFSDATPFPTETALCKEHNVSRFTVREALKRLQSEGLIERKRGSGTTVQPAAARGGALHQPLSNVGEILQYARDSQVAYEAGGSGSIPDEVAGHIDGDVSGSWTCFRGLRRSPQRRRPIALTHAYFHELLGEAVASLDLSAGTLFSQIEKMSGIRVGKVTQDIQAVAADTDTARALEIEEGDPVLRIIRCYVDPKGRIFEISVSHHPGERFAYSMHIDVES
ncbi:GntR family transcriptional regulator [Aurantiacibacter gangjinensis]|uniref:GntR family transcriptional regulator n=1 Tax=Aurantiacibacter gangjinensis TaxID=502682 RepID=A0A0G9MSJ3_9SPHN|nr:GntR family transcriptional regulator [Aurantiacibacter gangjinensis]